MAKSKAMVISGPMDAKHVGGVNVMMGGAQATGIDSYFKNTTLQPDETPSHTFVATGNIEVPKRSDTIASTIRRPSLSIKRSISRLRRKSLSHAPDVDRKIELENQGTTSIIRTESTKTHRSLRMQSSISRLRQRVGLDRDLNSSPSPPRGESPAQQTVLDQLHRDPTPLRIRRSFSRLPLRSASPTPEPVTEPTIAMQPVQRQHSNILRRPSPVEKQYFVPRRQSPPVASEYSLPKASAAPQQQKFARPKRTDSGTAIDLEVLPADRRPLGFQAILAVQSFEERMRHYERARFYWAHAEHGLAEWTQAAVAPRVGVRG